MHYHVVEARYVSGHVVWLRFRDGTKGEIDLAPVLEGPVFEPLRDPEDTIRAGNVWVDVQQVFYRMEENVSGCYAQKPLKAIERILRASTPGDVVLDLFAHSGTTLLAERLGRAGFTADIDPLFCEIAIRRLEHVRTTGRLGWRNGHAFEADRPEFSAMEALGAVGTIGREGPWVKTSSNACAFVWSTFPSTLEPRFDSQVRVEAQASQEPGSKRGPTWAPVASMPSLTSTSSGSVSSEILDSSFPMSASGYRNRGA